MQHAQQEIIVTIVVLLIVFLVLGFFILLVLIRHRTQTKKSLAEKQTMKLEFNQQLALSRLEIQEETFNNISQEIHDNVGQILSLVKMQLNIMLVSKTSNTKDIESVRDNAGRAMTELRNIAKNLNSEWLQDLQLEESITRELEYINKTIPFTIGLEISGAMALPNKTKIILFRIVQEACQNILKHAGANAATIKLFYDAESLHLGISDNGRGFDTAVLSASGMGLKNIRKRSSLIGARCSITSDPENRNCIHLHIPYTV